MYTGKRNKKDNSTKTGVFCPRIDSPQPKIEQKKQKGEGKEIVCAHHAKRAKGKGTAPVEDSDRFGEGTLKFKSKHDLRMDSGREARMEGNKGKPKDRL